MASELLLEIGTEEIPAGELERAIPGLGQALVTSLQTHRLGHGDIETWGTPRRIAALVHDVSARQPDVDELVVGPPARAAYDGDDQPTQAAIGFAKRNDVDVAELSRSHVEGKKGEYVVCRRQENGKRALDVLPEALTALLDGLPWQKSMRWGAREQSFVRPVQWLVALLDSEVIPFSFAGVSSGRTTRGHRFLAPETREIVRPQDYVETLSTASVVVDPNVRRAAIESELARIEADAGAVVRSDPALVAEVANLVEFPVGVHGHFDREFLSVPEEVVVSAMRSHQRYFAVEDSDGRLLNQFVTIAGTAVRDNDVVRKGNERVLAARLADASFFFREDQKVPFADFAGKLDGVVFQSKLGTIGAKSRRVAAVAASIATQVGISADLAKRTAELCKADLTTSMVGEFPDLQGVMGRYYALGAGEDGDVAEAIADHYAPKAAGDGPPVTALGAVVGLADRIDTLVGCFAVGLAPTGSADPYGLRRAAIGLIAILRDRSWSLSVSGLIAGAAERLRNDDIAIANDDLAAVEQFIATRLRKGLVDSDGLPSDCVEAALSIGHDDVPDTIVRAQAVADLRSRADFEPLAAAFKRIANILKNTQRSERADPARFVEEHERSLWDVFVGIESRCNDALERNDYREALQILGELKEPVDTFFDAVLVMDKDEDIKNNRLALLSCINTSFRRVADFRKLSV